MQTLLEKDSYNPGNLLDRLIDVLGVRNDAGLCRTLEITPSTISKIRNKRMPLGASHLIIMHEASNISIRELRAMMGDKAERFGN